jgi:hypothetical protein
VPYTFAPKFKKALRKKTAELATAILECVDQVDKDPRYPGLETHRVQGKPGVWEAYVDDANRVTFHREADGTVVFRNHCNHDMLRRNP